MNKSDQVITYHMVTVELLHDGGFIEKLNSLPHAGRLVDGLDGHACLWFILDHTLRQTLVHHAEGPLAELTTQRDFLPRHLPLVWNVHCTEKRT